MSKYDKDLAALRSVSEHLRTKDAGGDPMELLTKRVGELTDLAATRISGVESDLEKVAGALSEVDKRSRRAGAIQHGEKSWGAEFIDERKSELADLSTRNAGSVNLSVKSTLTSGTNSGGAIDVPMRDATVMMPMRRLMIRSLLNVIGTDSGTVEYADQITRDNAADTVAETALKPESGYEWQLKNIPTRVIAHWTKASNQILSDAPQVQGMIDSELRYGLLLKEEQQLLFGTNTGSQLDGMVPNAAEYADPLGLATPNGIDTIGTAILQVALADFSPSGIIMHPSDWMRLRLLKDNDNKYLLGDPQTMVVPNLFGVPVIPSKAMTVDKFLVGDFNMAATLYDRWQPRVEVGFVNDDFTRNMVTLRAEERIALAVKQANAMAYGDFGNVA